MTFVLEFEQATRDAEIARLRRVIAARAMLAEGESQRDVAKRLGVTQPAVSYQVARERSDGVLPSLLIAAGSSILRKVAERRGFSELAVFGSGARGDDRPDSDIDLLVQPPTGANLIDMVRLEEIFEAILGRSVDLVSYRGLDPKRDRDILRDRMPL